MNPRPAFRLPAPVRKACALLLLFVMGFGGAGTAQAAATEGYHPLRQITASSSARTSSSSRTSAAP